MDRARHLCCSMLSLCCFVTAAKAVPTITYYLDFPSDGNFTLWATTGAGDNAGLVFYSVPLVGNILTVDNRGPLAVNSANFSNIGFGAFRSADRNTPTTSVMITGFQDVVSGPMGNLIYGIGQSTSSFAREGYSTIFAQIPGTSQSCVTVPRTRSRLPSSPLHHAQALSVRRPFPQKQLILKVTAMNHRLLPAWWVLTFTCLVSTSKAVPTITYLLDLSGAPGTFQLTGHDECSATTPALSSTAFLLPATFYRSITADRRRSRRTSHQSALTRSDPRIAVLRILVPSFLGPRMLLMLRSKI